IQGYSMRGQFKQEHYKDFITDLQAKAKKCERFFTLLDGNDQATFQQRYLWNELQKCAALTSTNVTDISPLVYSMRRTKDQFEIALIHNAVQITHMAHETVAGMIEAGKKEHEVVASAEYVFMHVAGVQAAFPSVVATGKNATMLHYTGRMHELKNNELVVVDIGAEYCGYAADLSRTYPVSGMFTKRQRELYDIVLETQLYIESIAAIGMYLRNEQYPEQSLHHLAVAFLRKKKYDKYFCHGIGHFLGLDVHDVGDHNVPLKEGDAITIEPGIYIPEENIGIRIEDDYIIVQDGAACLSHEVPKQADEIEMLMNKLH
ncbi:MAG: M24 family metallopeptidase, partial [Candidatus Babeliales bacterium]